MTDRTRPRLDQFRNIKPQPVVASYDTLVRQSTVEGSKDGTPLMLEPAMSHVSLVGWAEAARPFIDRQLLVSGGLLLRGFSVPDSDSFRACAAVLADTLLDYTERAAPRTTVRPGVYTSTEFPPDQYIPLHHEMSYSHQWPRKIWFFCERPAVSGGCTPISDDRKVFRLLPQRIKDLFLEKKVMYVRNFGHGVDMSWQQAFQTEERSDVEKYCEQNGIEAEWISADHLRTRQVRQVTVVHPITGETVWFNHAHIFHWSNLDEATRSALFAQFKEDELPRNAFFGDGSPIPPDVLCEIRAVYESVSVRFTWQAGDILMLDNILMSHARDPFVGPRKVLVAMADLHRSSDVNAMPVARTAAV